MVRQYGRKRRQMRRRPRMSRKTYRGRSLLSRIPTARNTQVSIKRTFFSGTWALNSVATSDFWKYFEPTIANGFNGFTEFASVFDRYKVNAIKLTFRPRFDTVNAPITGNTPLTVRKPYMAYIVDPETAISPGGVYAQANLNVFLENGGKIVDADKPVSIYWKPKISLNTSIGSGVYFVKAPYLRTNEISTPMRGVHIFAYQQGFGTTFTDIEWDVFVTMYVTFKDLR